MSICAELLKSLNTPGVHWNRLTGGGLLVASDWE